MKNRTVCYFMLFVAFILYFNNALTKPAVTYDFIGGRFGDDILMYMRAKWVAYKYNMPILYKPFPYSDELALHDEEKKFEAEIKNYPIQVLLNNNAQIDPDYTKSIVYTAIPSGIPSHMKINWNDQGFIKELKKKITPKKPISQMEFPQGYITVAVHVRKGGYEQNLQQYFPCKFIDEQFYIDQIVWLYKKCKEAPLYIFIFTDDDSPEKIQDRFEKQLVGLNVIINCRKTSIGSNKSVLEDYFSFLQFDCFIHGLSNFSTTVSRIGDFYIEIEPVKDGKKIKANEKKVVEKPSLMPIALINYLTKLGKI